MQVSNSNLMQYTMVKKALINKDEGKVQDICVENIATSDIKKVSNVNYALPNSTANDISNVLSNEALQNTIDKILVPPEKFDTPIIKTMKTTYKDLSEGTISNIKQIIYDLHHKKKPTGIGDDDDDNSGGVGGDGSGGIGGDDDDDSQTEIDPPDPTKQSFLNDFNDTTTMFEYINGIDSTVTAESGITRAQLVALTQRDDWEDSNYDFFGSLNRVFNIIDTDSNGTLSYAEIKAFIGEEIGANVNTYKNKVNTYANQLEAQYQQMTDKQKLEFALERTEEYLTAAGLTDQLAALNRLKQGTDLYCDVSVGQIGFRDLNKENTSEYITLGSYTYLAATIEYEINGNTYSVAVWGGDTDEAADSNGDRDFGITLDISLLDGTWYNLVDVLVHELTHATASSWYNTDYVNGNIYYPTGTQVKKLYDAGIISASDYNTYAAKANAGTLTDDECNYLWYLACCAWGEYAAYQVDADYVDSIAGDVYDAGKMTTAVNGPNEKQTIINHIEAGYNSDDYTEPMPNYKWWSYA